MGGGVVRIELDRAPQQLTSLDDAGASRVKQRRPGAQHAVVSFEIFGRLGERTALLNLRHLDCQCLSDLSSDFVLQCEDVGNWLVKPTRPQDAAGRTDQPRADS